MGQLIDGQWVERAVPTTKNGEFKRTPSVFRNWVTRDGSPGISGEGGFRAESGRYHLYVSYACPWAHRTLIFRNIKGLQDHIGVSIVHPFMGEDGWTFDDGFDGATGDVLHDSAFLRDLYIRSEPSATSRVTVPVLWDIERGMIVSNESSEIIRMFNSAFDDITGNEANFWPKALREEIEPVNDRIYSTLNNGVYRCGFAKTQAAYEAAVAELFETLDWLEERLGGRRFLMGSEPTEADWRLLPTLLRFEAVYHYHFKCNIRRLRDFQNLWGYTLELYQWPGVAETTRLDHIKHHYYASHESINPLRIVPVGPEIDFDVPHGRFI